MIRYLFSFWLLLSCLGAGNCDAQDLPVAFGAGRNSGRDSIIEHIKLTLLRIHLVRKVNPDSAMAILNSIYKASNQLGYLEGVGAASAEIGATFMEKSDFEQAERYILYSQLLPGLNDYFTTNAANNLYLIYSEQGNYELALQYLKRAMKSKDKNVANMAYNNHIALLGKLGRYKESLYYIDILKTKAKALKQYDILVTLLSNEAAMYAGLKDYKMFDSVSAECLELSIKYHLDYIATLCHVNSGMSYFERGDVDKAIRLFARIKDEIPRLEPGYQVGYYVAYGKMLCEAGSYQAAISNLNKGLALGKQAGMRDLVDPFYYLAKSYKALGNHAEANEQYEHYIWVKDSFLNLDIQKNINEHEVKFRTGEKDNELLNKKQVILSQSSKISNRNILILLSAAGLVILILLFVAYHKYARQNLLVLEQNLDLAEQKSRVNFLKAMIQGEEKERKRIGIALHNGVGSQLTAVNLNLTAFQWKNQHIPEVDLLNEIITQIQQTAVEVRKTAHNLLPASITEWGLYTAIKEFTQQFKGSGVEFKISKSGDAENINAALALLVYRIVQELINNAIKYAEATRIDIDLKLDDNMFSGRIADNGKGFNLSGVTGRGLGIHQIQEQVEMLKGTFTLRTQPGSGTTVYFELDIKYNKDDLA